MFVSLVDKKIMVCKVLDLADFYEKAGYEKPVEWALCEINDILNAGYPEAPEEPAAEEDTKKPAYPDNIDVSDNSSWIESFSYSAGYLTMTLQDTRVYVYKDVPVGCWECIVKTASAEKSLGDLYNECIKGVYDRVDGPAVKAKLYDVEPEYLYVESSWIDIFTYDVDTRTLTMETIDNREYAYSNVPAYVWQRLKAVSKAGESVGSFYNNFIKGKYDGE
jgi:hypothetical protein